VSIQPRLSAWIWSEDLKSGRLPAVCVKTGMLADASVKFRFVTLPSWGYFLLFLLCTGIGTLPVIIIMRLVSRSEGGRLPYLRAAANRIRLWRWIAVGTFIGIPVLLFAALLSLSGDTTISALVWSAFLADLIAAVVVQYIVNPRIGPRGHVHESGYPQGRWVELRRVHPAFAAAMAGMYDARTAALPPVAYLSPPA
jgi:hypothetical protein